MKVCDLNSGLGQLAQALSQLKDRWGEVKSHWHDDASREFEEQHLAPLPVRLQRVVASAQRLAAVIDAAERELSDRAQES
jgi:hypothetical protein